MRLRSGDRWVWVYDQAGTFPWSGGYCLRVEKACSPPRARVMLRVGADVRRVIPAPADALVLNRWGTVESVCMKWLKTAVEEQVKADVQISGLLRSWSGKYEALWEYLTCDQDEKGSERERAMLMFFVDGSVFKACLQDRATSRSLWASGGSMEQALEALEGCLRSPAPDWRAMRGQHSNRSKKR